MRIGPPSNTFIPGENEITEHTPKSHHWTLLTMDSWRRIDDRKELWVLLMALIGSERDTLELKKEELLKSLSAMLNNSR